jgi:protein gp37
MNKTNIEWVKNPDGTQGSTWNPITGCLNHTDGLCKGGGFPCYAYGLANGRLKERYLANKRGVSPVNIHGVFDDTIEAEMIRRQKDPFYPRLWPERMDDPFLTNRNLFLKGQRHTRGQRLKPRGIFVCDMGELFGDWLPREWQEDIHLQISLNPQHRFYLLTKQPQNLQKWSPFPDNCWVGVTACTNGMTTMALQHLAQIEARVKFISFEPLLGQIGMNDHQGLQGIVGWVIIGAQTKPYKQPKIEWVQEIHDAADRAGIPIFLKDNLFPLFKAEMNYINKSWLRQEMPV